MTKTITLISFFSLLFLSTIHSQDCEASTAYTELDANSITAGLRIGGDLWWNGEEGKYLVPGADSLFSQVNAFLSGGIWLGALDPNANPLSAIAKYPSEDRVDFWPGPIEDFYPHTSSTICSDWDRFFPITIEQVEAHIQDYEDNGVIDNPIAAIFEWPGNASPVFEEATGIAMPENAYLAPFVDLDGDNVYNPEVGEYPRMKGDKSIWWVFNDSGAKHTASAAWPYSTKGFEISVMAYSKASDRPAIDLATFYDFTVRAKTTDFLDDFRLGLFVDVDLGCASDDFVGFDTTRNMAFAYNEDVIDGDNGVSCPPGEPSFGSKTPMIGLAFLDGIWINTDDVKFSVLTNPEVDEDAPPATSLAPTEDPFEIQRLLSGVWKDGEPITQGGYGYNPDSTVAVDVMFPGEPNRADAWSMCTDTSTANDALMLMTIGKERLDAGEYLEFTLAVMVAEQVDAPCPSLEPLRDTYDEITACTNELVNFPEIFVHYDYFSVVTNPIDDEIIITTGATEDYYIIITDWLGRGIQRISECKGVHDHFIDVSEWQDGSYFFTLHDVYRDKVTTRKMWKK